MSHKIAIITGVSGQSGSYLAELLVQKNYRVIGLTRNPEKKFTTNIQHLQGRIELLSTDYSFEHLKSILKQCTPHEVYNFTGQSHVGNSWKLIPETFRSCAGIVSDFLEAIIHVDKNIKFMQASSCDIFDASRGEVLTEESPFKPTNPYACAKEFAHNLVKVYREYYKLFAANAIFFQHESPRRGEHFLSKKLVKAAVEVKLGIRNKVQFGNLDVERDWGYVPDYVLGSYLMMQYHQPEDFNFCSGVKRRAIDMVETVFKILNLNFRDYVEFDQSLIRPNEYKTVFGTYQKAQKLLGWTPTTSFEDMLRELINDEIKRHKAL